MAANTWVTDLTHYLEADGQIADMPGRVERLAFYLGSVVEAVSRMPANQLRPLGIPCRRRPGRRPCAGRLEGLLELPEDRVVWGCPACGDNGYIYNWRGTPWDRGRVS